MWYKFTYTHTYVYISISIDTYIHMWNRTDKKMCIYMCVCIYIFKCIQWNISHKKERNNAICINMDGRRDDHTRWRKSGKERQILNDITHVRNLFEKWYKWTYLQNRNRYQKQTDGCQREKGGGVNHEFRMDRYTLLLTYFWHKVDIFLFPLCACIFNCCAESFELFEDIMVHCP